MKKTIKTGKIVEKLKRKDQNIRGCRRHFAIGLDSHWDFFFSQKILDRRSFKSIAPQDR